MTPQERQKKIFTMLTKAKELLEKEHGFNVWGIFLQGSQNYNLDVYNDSYMSDFDFKAFVIPTFDQLYSGKQLSTVYYYDFGQVEVKDIRKFHELLDKANPAAVELLFTDYKIVKSHRFIFEHADAYFNERRALIFMAMAKTVYGKFKTLFKVGEARQAEFERCGYDPKEYHHILRGKDILDRLNDGYSYKQAMQYNLDDELELEIAKGLISVKAANPPEPIEDVEYLCKQAIEHADLLAEANDLKKYPVKSDTLNLIYDVIKEIIKSQMLVETKHSSKEAFQYHAHFGQLTKEQRTYLENLGLGIGKQHFVDLLEYREYELINFWPIEYKKPEPEAALDAQEFQKEKERDKEQSPLLSPMD